MIFYDIFACYVFKNHFCERETMYVEASFISLLRTTQQKKMFWQIIIAIHPLSIIPAMSAFGLNMQNDDYLISNPNVRSSSNGLIRYVFFLFSFV